MKIEEGRSGLSARARPIESPLRLHRLCLTNIPRLWDYRYYRRLWLHTFLARESWHFEVMTDADLCIETKRDRLFSDMDKNIFTHISILVRSPIILHIIATTIDPRWSTIAAVVRWFKGGVHESDSDRGNVFLDSKRSLRTVLWRTTLREWSDYDTKRGDLFMNVEFYFDTIASVVTVKWSGNHGWVAGHNISTIYITKWH